MKTFNVCDVEISIVDGPIGINCSGGADSSLLLYILLANRTDPLYCFTLANNLKARTPAIVSANVIEKCIQLTNNNNIIHIVKYIDHTEFVQNLKELPQAYIDNNTINYRYTGVTANPPKSVGDSFLGESQNTCQEDRTPDIIRDTYYDLNKIFTPFTNINKRKVIEMYRELGIKDSLFPVTRSCEIINKLGFFGHCGECWWCKEREWSMAND